MKAAIAAAWISGGAVVLAALIGLLMMLSRKETPNQISTGNHSPVINAYGNNQHLQINNGPESSKEDSDNILEIKKMVKAMQKVENTDYEYLIKRYPKGYSLFAITHSEFVVPSKSNLLRDYDINWEPTKIESLTPDHIDIVLPYIHTKKGGGIAGFATQIPRNSQEKIFNFPFQGIFPDKIYIEVLSDNSDGIVYVMGFK